MMIKHQLTLFVLLLLFASCGNDTDKNTTDDALENAVPVYVQELSPQTFRHYINVQGNVESDRTIVIAPKLSATVKEIRVKAGDTVKKGQVLAVLDGDITKSQITGIETQIELAEDLFTRQQNLRDQNIGSEVEYLQSKTQLQSLKDQKATLVEQYNNYTIKATISGTVDRVMLKIGESVGPENIVFQIANSDALKVLAEISEAYIQSVDETDSVEISFTSLDTKITKTIDVVSKVINRSNRTFSIEVYIPNTYGNIRTNMITKLKINDYTAYDQILIPVNTLQISNGDRFVYVAVKQDEYWIAQRRDVKTGMNSGNKLVILEGLNPGDMLITTGYNSVAHNDIIVIK